MPWALGGGKHKSEGSKGQVTGQSGPWGSPLVANNHGILNPVDCDGFDAASVNGVEMASRLVRVALLYGGWYGVESSLRREQLLSLSVESLIKHLSLNRGAK